MESLPEGGLESGPEEAIDKVVARWSFDLCVVGPNIHPQFTSTQSVCIILPCTRMSIFKRKTITCIIFKAVSFNCQRSPT